MRLQSLVLVALASACPLSAGAQSTPTPTPAPVVASDPVADRAQAITEAASLLTKASQARQKGNRNFAEQLFSSAEIILGPDAVAELSPLFREGAPPRIATPLKVMPKDTPSQPAVVGGSEEEDPPPPAPKRGTFAGVLKLGDKELVGRGVVALEPVGTKWKPRAPKARVMEQRNRDFAPKLLVVRQGSTVSFPNFDNVYHNVFSRSDARQFDLGIYKGGQARELAFDKEGIVRLGCNLHANMAGYIVVVNAPHYAVTDEHGGFKFKSLPPGRYKVRAYSEKSQAATTQEVTINADATTNVTIPVSTEGGAPSVDKFGTPRGK